MVDICRRIENKWPDIYWPISECWEALRDDKYYFWTTISFLMDLCWMCIPRNWRESTRVGSVWKSAGKWAFRLHYGSDYDFDAPLILAKQNKQYLDDLALEGAVVQMVRDMEVTDG